MELILVTGMHRTGSSAITRVINILGADIGPVGDLMAAKPDNPTGFWENQPIVQLNDDLISQLGGRWDDPPVVSSDDWPERVRFRSARSRAERILQAFDADVAVVKDPRLSLVLPFWRSLAVVRRTVVCTRSPIAVSNSLFRRDGMEPDRGAELFSKYQVAAWLDGVDPLVVAYEDLLRDPVGETKRIAQGLSLPPPSARILSAVRGHVDAALDHGVGETGEMTTELAQANAVDQLLRSGDSSLLDPIFATYQGRLRVEAGHEADRRRLRVSRQAIRDMTGQRDRVLALVEEREGERDQARYDWQQAVLLTERLQVQLRQSEERAAQLGSNLEAQRELDSALRRGLSNDGRVGRPQERDSSEQGS
ncbi:hypothetical protein HQ535_10835 [bacterium]|nr:hypothetical protein [bacterium]